MPRALAALNLPRRIPDLIMRPVHRDGDEREPRGPLTDLVALRTYVEDVADASPGESAMIVATAGMRLERSSGHTKPTFEVTQGLASGAVRLVAEAARTRASYDGQRSQEGSLWIDLPRTVRADAELSGLLPGAEHSFRYRTLTRDGVVEWSQTVSFFVR